MIPLVIFNFVLAPRSILLILVLLLLLLCLTFCKLCILLNEASKNTLGILFCNRCIIKPTFYRLSIIELDMCDKPASESYNQIKHYSNKYSTYS